MQTLEKFSPAPGGIEWEREREERERFVRERRRECVRGKKAREQEGEDKEFG